MSEAEEAVKRLREIGAISANWAMTDEAEIRRTCRKAADCIERQTERVKALELECERLRSGRAAVVEADNSRRIVTCSLGHRSTVPADAYSDGYAATHSCPVCGRGVPKERPMERPVEHGGLRAAVGEAPDLGPGLAYAVTLIEKRRENYIRENCKSVGNSGDWEGTVAQDEYVSELDDIIELISTAIRSLAGTP